MNMKNMRDVVENFQFDYTKWNKQALSHDQNLPYSLFNTLELQKIENSNDVEVHYLNIFPSNKEKVQYFIRNFVITQNAYFRYFQAFVKQNNLGELEKQSKNKPIYLEKFYKLYLQKYGKTEQKWKIGQSYELGYQQMIECGSQENKKSK